MKTIKGLNEANRPLLGGDRVCARVDKDDIDRINGLIRRTGKCKSFIIRNSIRIMSDIFDKNTFERLGILSKKYRLPYSDVIKVAINRLYLEDKHGKTEEK